MLKRIGYALFAIGTLIGISGGAKMPPEGSDWPDTVWIFVVGALLAMTGVVLWRLALKAETKAAVAAVERAGRDDRRSAVELLRGLMEPARALEQDAGELDAQALESRVDSLLEEWVLPLAEVRRQLIDRYGMAKGAEVLVTVAYGERMLNRVWSAAADGHLPEARACVPEAVEALAEANDLLDKAA